jgi:hypothetical protein
MTQPGCVECGAKTERGAMIGYQDGTIVITPYCAFHMAAMARDMQERGVRIERADRLN